MNEIEISIPTKFAKEVAEAIIHESFLTGAYVKIRGKDDKVVMHIKFNKVSRARAVLNSYLRLFVALLEIIEIFWEEKNGNTAKATKPACAVPANTTAVATDCNTKNPTFC
ncbi:MAG: hypothetical protein AB1779_02365 [Candidatus Thermoplasmatota archaeon]